MRRLPWLLLLAAVILPCVALVPQSQHVFWLPESALWLSFVPFAALLAWWSTRDQVQPQVPENLKRSFIALWVLWGLAALAALRRDLGFLAWAEWSCYALLFFAVWRLATNEARRRKLIALLLLYGVASSVYAAMQALGWDSIAWTTSFGGRSGAFLGNPNFLGGHLALLFPVALALALDRRLGRRGPLRTVWPWALVLVLGAGLLLAQTRGAWLGVGVGTVLVLVLAQRHMGSLLSRNRSVLLSLGVVGLLGLSVYFAARPQAWARVTGTFSSGDPELSRRGFLMTKAAQMANRRPLLGAGPGNFRLRFAQVQAQGLDPQAFMAQPYVVSEHAHNDFLQMAAEAGWPAALLWAALMVLVLKALYQSFAKAGVARDGSQGGLLGLGVFGGVTALLVHGLANFPFLILPTQGAAWVLVALVLRAQAAAAGAGRGDPAPTDVLPSGLIDDVHVAASVARPLRYAGWLLGLDLAICGASVVYNGRRLALDRLWWIGQGELQLQHFDQAAPWLQRALALDRREDRLWDLAGRAEQGRGQLEKSISSLREAQRLAPFDADIALRLGRNLVQARQYDEAEKVLRGASAYAPNYAELWDPLAASLYFQGKHAEAIQVYERMIALKLGAENAYVNKAVAQGSLGDLAGALQTLQQADALYPEKPKVQLNAAITYLKLGQKPQARAALKRAMQLDPQDPQIVSLQKALR